MTNPPAPFKPWKNYSAQLDHLKARGLWVKDEQRALRYLERLGYYRLSGYWYPLRKIDPVQSAAQNKAVRSSEFCEGSRFEQIVDLYVFDKKLRLLALDALERIEMALRVDIAHLLGKKHPVAHTLPRYFHGHFAKQTQTKGPHKGRTEHDVWMEKYQSLLKRAKHDPAIIHNVTKYGQPPIWVAIEVWDFGTLSKLYAGMLHADQDSIAAKYGASDGRELAKWLRSFNFIRNVAAHHSRLWNINILERSDIPQGLPQWQYLSNQRPFLYFCLMAKMLKVICPNSHWSERLIGALANFPQENFNLADFDVKNLDEARRLLGQV